MVKYSVKFTYKLITLTILQLLILNSLTNCKLLSVVELFRHGARSPLNKNELTNNLFLPYHSGDLTANGSKQHRILGKYIKSKYIINNNNKNSNNNILSSIFNPNEVKIYSLDIPRCVNSAISHLSAMYDDNEIAFNYQYYKSIYNNDNNYNKDNINSDSINNDIYYSHSQIFYENLKDITPNKNQNYLKEKTEINQNDVVINILDLTNNKLLAGRECFKKEHNYTIILTEEEKLLLENNLNKTFIENMNEIVSSNYSISSLKKLIDLIETTDYHFPRLFNLSSKVKLLLYKIRMKYSYELHDDLEVSTFSSNLFDEILQNFKNLIEKNNSYKMLIFSARDINIKDLIYNLIDPEYIKNKINQKDLDKETIDFLLPPFASLFLFELHEINNGYFVKIFYNGKENFRNLRTLDKGEKVIYTENGINFESFKKLLSSRINPEFKSKKCPVF
jgi:hypothetical protein